MKSFNHIREDLKEIRYYYSRKHEFDKAQSEIGKSTVTEKVERYNAAVRSAPPKLYDVYVCLYVRNMTQEALANELCYAPEYVWVLNNKLLEFLQNHVS